jgi:ABC-2 type transport system permease protein
LALHAEWTKFRTLPGMFWLPVAAAVLTVAVGAIAAGEYHCAGSMCTAAGGGGDPARISLTGIYLGQVLVAVLAVLVVGGEYGNGMIHVTLAAVPRRQVLLLAKAAVVAGLTFAAALAGVLGSMATGRLVLTGRGMTPANGYLVLSPRYDEYLRAGLGSVLYLVLVALLALGITMAVRDSGVAIGVVLGLLLLFPLVIAVMPDHALARHLEQASPVISGLSIEATINESSLPLAPWQGLGVLALWAGGALLLGGLLLRRRDA